MRPNNLPKVPKLICGILIQVYLSAKRNGIMEDQSAKREQMEKIISILDYERKYQREDSIWPEFP